jgi:hypothetical protein
MFHITSYTNYDQTKVNQNKVHIFWHDMGYLAHGLGCNAMYLLHFMLLCILATIKVLKSLTNHILFNSKWDSPNLSIKVMHMAFILLNRVQ